MPHSRRRALSVVAGVLFAANALGLFFALRSVIPAADSSGQYAGSAQVVENTQTAENATTSAEVVQ